MHKDSLRDTLTSIEKWCEDNDVSIFYGRVDENAATEVSWENITDNDWIKYLTIAKKLTVKILLVNIIENKINIEDEDILGYQGVLEDEKLNEFREALEIIKNTNGYIIQFELIFFHDNVCYSLTRNSDWINEYHTVQEAFNNEGYVDDYNDAQTEELSDERIEELARLIACDEKYITAKNNYKKSEVIRLILEQEGVTDDFYTRLVEIELNGIFEEEVKRRVLELKSKGVTKNEIASKLDISINKVNKYYFKDI